MRLRIAFLLSALGGYVALSYEILWVRVYGFLTWWKAHTFGTLLGAYLAGIALGSFAARRWCRSRSGSEVRALAFFLAAANLAAFLLIPAVAELVRFAWAGWPLVIFALVAALLGTSFPLVAHFGIPAEDRVGLRLSYLYLGNILGSAVGSLLTGLVLLDHLSLAHISVLLALLGLGMASGAVELAGLRRRAHFAVLAAAAGVVLVAPPLFGGVYEKLTFKEDYRPGMRFRQVVETRSGVVTADDEGVVRGGAVYDGKFNVDPVADTNDVIRAYAVFALRPAVRTVCVVGLGSGSWAQVLVSHPSVERLTAIEINPGYLDVIREAPEVRSLLDNPKVEIIVDDGRRWLARTDRTFDAIVQNTSYHWRAHATNLLSREYLELCAERLNPGGLLLYNTTHSRDAQRTGLELFAHAWLLERAMYVSDAPLEPDFARWAELVRGFEIDGKRIVPVGADLGRLLDPTRWVDRETLVAATRDATVITDDNMASEWR